MKPFTKIMKRINRLYPYEGGSIDMGSYRQTTRTVYDPTFARKMTVGEQKLLDKVLEIVKESL